MKKKLMNWIFNWFFKEKLEELNKNIENLKAIEGKNQICLQESSKIFRQLNNQKRLLDSILKNMEISVDIHEKTGSWAVISIQGEKSSFIKFVDLNNSSIHEIARFLSQFEHHKIDSSPFCTKYIKEEIYQIKNGSKW